MEKKPDARFKNWMIFPAFVVEESKVGLLYYEDNRRVYFYL